MWNRPHLAVRAVVEPSPTRSTTRPRALASLAAHQPRPAETDEAEHRALTAYDARVRPHRRPDRDGGLMPPPSPRRTGPTYRLRAGVPDPRPEGAHRARGRPTAAKAGSGPPVHARKSRAAGVSMRCADDSWAFDQPGSGASTPDVWRAPEVKGIPVADANDLTRIVERLEGVSATIWTARGASSSELEEGCDATWPGQICRRTTTTPGGRCEPTRRWLRAPPRATPHARYCGQRPRTHRRARSPPVASPGASPAVHVTSTGPDVSLERPCVMGRRPRLGA